ncbi:Fe(2+) transporter permease subunit FeoB [Bacterioplanoides sp. SCSIO 12839]|uniref:Fe(2+) transporter permease subunit FeoB n=1 Tax=Bacterioplanoides sp. SCSIO 12839 TaxID=2829569 RepID=UPI002101F98A|nr:Fe(2+) transporter permease subunit FeoB [Bacterioplanoides sp. SCSIO 12839]UTW48647.1 Fe(2+) transporter permease subunit FeoB [Bacterioplanoides sp. SCSIO 12839]
MSLHIVTVGNPNSGKTSLFNALTGSRQQVGNWSGVTVDKKEGRLLLPAENASHPDTVEARLIDLPGIYSLDVNDAHSVDEQIAFSYITDQRPDLIINVIDATTLERGLYLTLQLRELGLPVVVVLNKMDAARRKRLNIDLPKLQQSLACPVVALSAHHQKQVKAFQQQLPDLFQQAQLSPALQLDYAPQVEQAQQRLAPLAQPLLPHLHGQALALRVLERDPWLLKQLSEDSQQQVLDTGNSLELDLDLHIADTRFSWIYQLTQQAVSQEGKLAADLSDNIDRLLLNQWLGIPVFLAVMYLMFQFSINVGSAFIDFFDIAAGAVFVDGISEALTQLNAPGWLDIILAQGFGAGVQTVLTFIPVIACLYLFLSVLESSGYLARASFVVDRLMQKIGLPGKSFVPMIMGFGCTVPAVMAARTLDKERERLITSFMSPFMSCGARLPVYALFVAAFFPDNGQNIVFLLYLCGVAAAVITGLVLRYTLLPGSSENFLLEMPDYEIPTLRNVGIKTWQKLKGFLTGAGKTIVWVVAVLSVLNNISLDGRFGNLKDDESVLAKTSQMITPVFSPLGVEADNWEATIGIVTGIFAKEAVVGTLNSLYSGAAEEGAEYDLFGSLNEALATIPENLFGISLSDPIGLDIGDISSLETAAAEQEVEVSTLNTLLQKFDGSVGAFAYMLFILLYTPCAAAMGAFVREVGPRWSAFIAVWSMGMAFMISTLFYQLATFSRHPQASLLWLLFYSLAFALVVILMRRRGDVMQSGWRAAT